MVQDMLYMYHLLESLKQKVELPMVLEMNNSIAVDIADSWSAGDKPQHVDVQNYLLCKLKDQELLIIRQISGDSNDVDIFAKNVLSAVFISHIPLYMGTMSTYKCMIKLRVRRLSVTDFYTQNCNGVVSVIKLKQVFQEFSESCYRFYLLLEHRSKTVSLKLEVVHCKETNSEIIN